MGGIPSALELEWMAQIRMHFEAVCERSAITRKTFIDILNAQVEEERLLLILVEVVRAQAPLR